MSGTIPVVRNDNGGDRYSSKRSHGMHPKWSDDLPQHLNTRSLFILEASSDDKSPVSRSARVHPARESSRVPGDARGRRIATWRDALRPRVHKVREPTKGRGPGTCASGNLTKGQAIHFNHGPHPCGACPLRGHRISEDLPAFSRSSWRTSVPRPRHIRAKAP